MDTMFQESGSVRRNDLHLTSTGVATKYHTGMYFPNIDFKRCIDNPLPAGLAIPDRVLRNERHSTTSRSDHNKKFIFQNYIHPTYQKSASSNNISFIKDLSEKHGEGGWKKPLSMKNEQSETHEEFSNPDGLKYSYAFDDVFKKRPFLLHDHLNYGPSRIGQPTGLEKKCIDYEFNPEDKEIFNVLSPKATTYQMSYHGIKPDDLQKLKDIDLVYPHVPQCFKTSSEDNSLKLIHKKLPMKDSILFRHHTVIPRPPKDVTTVPHNGFLSEYTDIYQTPSHLNQKYNHFCPLETPWVLPKASLSAIMTVPKFYTTDYQNIGSEVPLPV